MKFSALDVYRCPETGLNLTLEEGALIEENQIIEGSLVSEGGNKYRISKKIPIFLDEKHIIGKAAAAVEYYSKNSQNYDEYLPVAFELFNTDERTIRDKLTDLLFLKPGQKVLDLTAGTGKDSIIIAKKLQQGELWLTDITREMLDVAVSRLTDIDIFKEFATITACALPFKDNYFDALYSFTGLGSFPDVAKGLREMSRVVRTGGKVVFCEKSVPPWLRGTEYGNILIEANPMFSEEIPLRFLPRECKDVEIRWIMENAFYVISYTVGDREPQGNFSIELPGPRGGSFFTRYFGKLEGVTLETKTLAQMARDKSGRSMHKWLDEVVRRAAEKELDN